MQFMNLVCGTGDNHRFGWRTGESTYLGIPCLTLRDNTEKSVTVKEGSNRLVKTGDLYSQIQEVLAIRWPPGRRPALWDGQTAKRCVGALRVRIGV